MPKAQMIAAGCPEEQMSLCGYWVTNSYLLKVVKSVECEECKLRFVECERSVPLLKTLGNSGYKEAFCFIFFSENT